MSTNKLWKPLWTPQVPRVPISQNRSRGVCDDVSTQVIQSLDKTTALLPHETVVKEVFYIRHGATNDEKGSDSNSAQSPYVLLSDNGKSEVLRAMSKLKDLWAKGEDICIYFSSDTVRIEQTLHIFKREFWLDSNQCVDDCRLRTTRKPENEHWVATHLPKDIQYVEVMGITAEVAQLMEDVKGIDKKFVILLWHKTNKLWAEGITLFNQKNLEGTFLMPTWGILSFSINGNDEYINYNENKDLMHIANDEDFKKLQALFPFPDISFDSVIDFQNYLNFFFKNTEGLYWKYLTHKSSSASLRVFCLANLIKLKEYAVIEEYCLNQCNSLSAGEKELLLQSVVVQEIKSTIQQIFVSHEELWSDDDRAIFVKYELLDFYDGLIEKRATYKKAMEIQKRSILSDVAKNNGIKPMEREILSQEITGDFSIGFKTKIVHLDFNAILKYSATNKYILQDHFGAGKSYWMAEFVKYACMRSDIKIIFYEWSEFNGLNSNQVSERLVEMLNSGATLCIDAVDEIANSENKSHVLNFLNRRMGRYIVTSRPETSLGNILSEYGSFSGEKHHRATDLWMRPLDARTYLTQYLNVDSVEKILARIKRMNMSEDIGGNPLILSFIAILEDIDTISNIAELYEKAIKFTLSKHQTKKGLSIPNDKVLERYMKQLWQIAREISKRQDNKENMEEKYDLSIFQTFIMEIQEYRGTRRYTKVKFTHKSFYEFFLAWSYVNDNQTPSYEDLKFSHETLDIYFQILSNKNQMLLCKSLKGYIETFNTVGNKDEEALDDFVRSIAAIRYVHSTEERRSLEVAYCQAMEWYVNTAPPWKRMAYIIEKDPLHWRCGQSYCFNINR